MTPSLYRKFKLLMGLSLISSVLVTNAYSKTYHMNTGRNGQNSARFGTSQNGRLNFEFYIGSFEGEKSTHANDSIDSLGELNELKFKNFKMTNDRGKVALPYQSFLAARAGRHRIPG